MNGKHRVDPVDKKAATEGVTPTAVAYFALSGMNCPRCVTWVRNSLLATSGVTQVEVDLTMGLSRVVFTPGLTTIPTMINAIVQAENDGHHQYQAVLLDQAEIA